MALSARFRRFAVVAAVGALVLVGLFVVRYTVFLDFDAYVEELGREHTQALFARAPDAQDDIAEGRLDRANEAIADLRSRARDESSQRRLTDQEVESAAAALAAGGVLDMQLVSRVLSYWSMKEEGAAERFRAGVERMAAERGAWSRVVVALNGWRIEDVFRARIEESRADAEAQLDALDDDQRRALERAWRTHGDALFGGVLRLDDALQVHRALAALRRIADRLAESPPAERTEAALGERVDEIRWDDMEAGDAMETLGCVLVPELLSPETVRLELDCGLDLDDEGTDALRDATLVVDLPAGMPTVAPAVEWGR
jgi:hypothetical protein